MSEELGTGELFEVAAAILRANPYGFLTTIGDDVPHARLVQHVAVDEDGTIWIGTSPKSRKAADIAMHPRVAYAVQDRTTPAYACVYATAEVVDDLATRKERWIAGFRTYFPDGPDGDDFVLLRLRPYAVEVLDFVRRIHPDPFGLVPARAELD